MIEGLLRELKRPVQGNEERRLVVCEGETEAAFMRAVLQSKALLTTFEVRVAGGGSGATVIERAATEVVEAGKAGRPFVNDGRWVLLDVDRGALPLSAQRRAQKFELRLFWSRPCFEAEVLRWLGHDAPTDSRAAKALFEAKVLDRAAKIRSDAWCAVTSTGLNC
ncbi:MAG: hypothetical protein ACFBZ8_13705 [Opitutales bacterium]